MVTLVEWEDEAFVLGARSHGETGGVGELLTLEHGRFAAHVAGAASRRMKPVLPFARVRPARLCHIRADGGGAVSAL